MTKEIWKDIPDYEGLYQVSNFGNVKSLPKIRTVPQGINRWPGKNLKAFTDHTGYMYVNLSNGKKVRKTGVHRLVLLAFVGAPEAGLIACHNDGNRKNNLLSNLRWDTFKANAADMIEHGTAQRGEKSTSAKLTLSQVREIRVRKESSLFLAPLYGVASSTIRAIRINQNWRHE